MTFDQIVNEICEALNLTSDDAKSRVGRSVNRRYRRLTSSVGLITSRFIPTSATATAGSRNLTFTNVEKLLAVVDKTDPDQDIMLEEITPDEMHITQLRSGSEMPRHFAILTMDPTSVTIEVDVIPAAGATSAVAAAAGVSYSLHDTLTLVGGVLAEGSAGIPSVCTVTSVNGSGGVTGVSITTPGLYTTFPTNPVSVTGGTGTGCTLTVTWATPFTLYADAVTTVTTLSGKQCPDFPESFHDILVLGGMADEYRKMEKFQFYKDCEAEYENRASDLRLFIAKSAYKDIFQGRLNARSFWWSRDAQLLWDE